jgi:hypothetical protein
MHFTTICHLDGKSHPASERCHLCEEHDKWWKEERRKIMERISKTKEKCPSVGIGLLWRLKSRNAKIDKDREWHSGVAQNNYKTYKREWITVIAPHGEGEWHTLSCKDIEWTYPEEY